MQDDPAFEPDIEPAQYAEFKEMRLKRTSPKPGGRDAYGQLKSLLVGRLSTYLEQEPGMLDAAEMRPFLVEHFNELLVEERIVLTGTERRNLFEDILGEVSGSGPLVDGDGSGRS